MYEVKYIINGPAGYKVDEGSGVGSTPEEAEYWAMYYAKKKHPTWSKD
jgi:hypothetical protein